MDEHFMKEIAEADRIALRDKFAMAALTGMLADPEGTVYSDNDTRNLIAKRAYALADAMLRARQEKP